MTTNDAWKINPRTGVEYKFFTDAHGGIHGESIALPRTGRISFPCLVNPGKVYNKYQVAFLYQKNDAVALPQLKNIQHMCLAMMTAKFGAKAAEAQKLFKRSIFRDGDSSIGMSKDGRIYDGYAGAYVINAAVAPTKEGTNPIDFKKVDKTPEAPSAFKGGMICDGVVQPFLNADGFSYKLKSIRLIKDDGTRWNSFDSGSLLEDVEIDSMDVEASIQEATMAVI
jgi:hypothetical protein